VEDERRVAMEVLRADSKITPEINSEGVKIRINVEVVGNIGEVQDKNLDINDPGAIPGLELKLSGTVTREIWAAINRARDLDADIFSFGEKVRRKYPRQWREYSSRWDSLFRTTPVEVSVNVVLKRTGKIINPVHAVISCNTVER
jgi:spore germination protein KC